MKAYGGAAATDSPERGRRAAGGRGQAKGKRPLDTQDKESAAAFVAAALFFAVPAIYALVLHAAGIVGA